jgi:hypothetical protein
MNKIIFSNATCYGYGRDPFKGVVGLEPELQRMLRDVCELRNAAGRARLSAELAVTFGHDDAQQKRQAWFKAEARANRAEMRLPLIVVSARPAYAPARYGDGVWTRWRLVKRTATGRYIRRVPFLADIDRIDRAAKRQGVKP